MLNIWHRVSLNSKKVTVYTIFELFLSTAEIMRLQLAEKKVLT